MKRGFWFHPQARAELERAVRHYGKESSGLGEGLLNEVQANIDLVCARPHLGPPAAAGTRRRVLNRFPYTLFYRDQEDVIQIFAVAHHRRKPGYWVKRVQ